MDTSCQDSISSANDDTVAHEPAKPDDMSFAFCMPHSTWGNDRQTSTNLKRLLFLVPQNTPHGTMHENSNILACYCRSSQRPLRANEGNSKMQRRSSPTAGEAGGITFAKLWLPNGALLSWQGLETHPKIDNRPELRQRKAVQSGPKIYDMHLRRCCEVVLSTFSRLLISGN